MKIAANIVFFNILLYIFFLLYGLQIDVKNLEKIQPIRFINITSQYNITNLNGTWDIRIKNVPIECYDNPSSTDCLIKIENSSELWINWEKIVDNIYKK